MFLEAHKPTKPASWRNNVSRPTSDREIGSMKETHPVEKSSRLDDFKGEFQLTRKSLMPILSHSSQESKTRKDVQTHVWGTSTPVSPHSSLPCLKLHRWPPLFSPWPLSSSQTSSADACALSLVCLNEQLLSQFIRTHQFLPRTARS